MTLVSQMAPPVISSGPGLPPWVPFTSPTTSRAHRPGVGQAEQRGQAQAGQADGPRLPC